jgi:hypothetical protein
MYVLCFIGAIDFLLTACLFYGEFRLGALVRCIVDACMFFVGFKGVVAASTLSLPLARYNYRRMRCCGILYLLIVLVSLILFNAAFAAHGETKYDLIWVTETTPIAESYNVDSNVSK